MKKIKSIVSKEKFTRKWSYLFVTGFFMDRSIYFNQHKVLFISL